MIAYSAYHLFKILSYRCSPLKPYTGNNMYDALLRQRCYHINLLTNFYTLDKLNIMLLEITDWSAYATTTLPFECHTSMRIIRWLCSKAPEYIVIMFKNAIKYKHILACKWFLKIGILVTPDMFGIAFENGDYKMVRRLLPAYLKNFSVHDIDISNICIGNNIKILRLLKRIGARFDSQNMGIDLIIFSIYYKSWDTVEWLLRHNIGTICSEAILTACRFKSSQVALMMLEKKGCCEFTNDELMTIAEEAILNGQIRVVEYLINKGVKPKRINYMDLVNQRMFGHITKAEFEIMDSFLEDNDLYIPPNGSVCPSGDFTPDRISSEKQIFTLVEK